MTQKDEKKLILLEGTKTEEQTTHKVVPRQTNPIVKKLLQFHNENSEKFSVKDLFKK